MGLERSDNPRPSQWAAGFKGGARPCPQCPRLVLPIRGHFWANFIFLVIYRMSRSRGWCFTINNYTVDDMSSFLISDIEFEYGIVGFEKGEQGTPHMQGYVYNSNKRRLREMKKIFPRAHLEPQKGTQIQALLYCMKDDDWYEFGERPRQGRRSDIDVVRHDIRKGKKKIEIANQYFGLWCQYRRSFDEYASMCIRYKTVMYHYVEDDLERLYAEPDLDVSLIVKPYDECSMYEQLMHAYYSHKYKYIYVPYNVYYNNIELLYGKILKYDV